MNKITVGIYALCITTLSLCNHDYSTINAIIDQWGNAGPAVLHAPWRQTIVPKPTESMPIINANDCVFCQHTQNPHDEVNYILARFKHHCVALNIFPYGIGHLLILPYDHVNSIEKLSPEARLELIELIAASVDIVKKELSADGVNVGINIGKAGGASIPDHLHIHVLPRKYNDRNSFIQVLGRTEIAPCDLLVIYQKLRPAFQQLTSIL